jgi:hypothetical protein
MTAAEQNPHNASSDGNQKSSDKEISGNRKGKTGMRKMPRMKCGDDAGSVARGGNFDGGDRAGLGHPIIVEASEDRGRVE